MLVQRHWGVEWAVRDERSFEFTFSLSLSVSIFRWAFECWDGQRCVGSGWGRGGVGSLREPPRFRRAGWEESSGGPSFSSVVAALTGDGDLGAEYGGGAG